MAGGIFTTMNKPLPGAYINVQAAASQTAPANGGGKVFTVLSGLGWGADGVITLKSGSDFKALLGRDLTDPALTGLRQVLVNADTVYAYNVNPGAPATGQSPVLPWQATAACNGQAGDAITVTVNPDAADPGKYVVQTTYDSVVVDKQSVASASGLADNAYVAFTVTPEAAGDDGAALLAALVTPVSVQLQGGQQGDVAGSVSAMQEAIDSYEFNTMVAADSPDTANVHALLATAARRNREELGRKLQAVIPGAAGLAPDYEGVIVVGNTVRMADGTTLTQSQFAGFVAGAEAAAADNQSLTYAQVPGAVDAAPRLSDEQAVAAITAGQLVARPIRGTVRIEEDVNSLVTFTAAKGSDMSKNRVIRTLDAIGNWVKATWEDNFVGKVTNDEAGLDLLKAAIVDYLGKRQDEQAIIGFSGDDVQVGGTADGTSVTASLAVQPTDAMEKLYMTVSVA